MTAGEDRIDGQRLARPERIPPDCASASPRRWIGRQIRRAVSFARPSPGKAVAAARIGSDTVFVVIRAAGERTTAAVRALAAAEVADDAISVLREVPFATAVRKGFERGLEAGAEWTLCLDADVALRPGAISDLVMEARRQDASLFGISGRVADPLLGQFRFAGQHLYRTSLLGQAVAGASFDPAKRRPESHVKRFMQQQGHGWMQTDVVAGFHDADQFYADIFRKVVVHSRKHARFLPYLRQYWTRAGVDAPDLRVALVALEEPDRIAPIPGRAGASEAETIAIDRRLFPERIDAFLASIDLEEKALLHPGALRPDHVERRLAKFREAPEWLAAKPGIEADWGPQNRAGPI